MKRTTPDASIFDFRISGDKLEQDRIELEHNLFHTDLSLHLSSNAEIHDHQDYSSVEYPRHNLGPSSPPHFTSFGHHTGNELEPSDEGISPYAGETMSTAAHHASALTLSAGLAGRPAARNRGASGVEYDPDRPWEAMVARATAQPSLFVNDSSELNNFGPRSDSPVHGDAGRNPAFQSNRSDVLNSRPIRVRSLRASKSPSASASDSDSSGATPRPRLSEALHRVSFSPQRPRSAQLCHAQVHQHQNLHTQYGNVDFHTFRPSRPSPFIQEKSSKGTFHPSQSALDRQRYPQLAASSQSSKTSKVIVNESIVERGLGPTRNPFRDVLNESDLRDGLSCPLPSATFRRSSFKNSRRKSLVQLPDVTGLTSAIESPAKPLWKHHQYCGENRVLETESRLVSTLTAVHSTLRHLESENGISRRRIRELELELEQCKREAAREHTRELRKDESNFKRRRDNDQVNGHTIKRGQACTQTSELQTERYEKIVDEKKALEALVETLRTHLLRLTAELSSQRQLLTELRALRESDRKTLKRKSVEVQKLRNDVERLAKEVEVLRTVVEEGLKQRQLVKEQQSRGNSYDHVPTPESTHEDRTEDAADGIGEASVERSISEGEDLEYTYRHLELSRSPEQVVQTGHTVHTSSPHPLIMPNVMVEQKASERTCPNPPAVSAPDSPGRPNRESSGVEWQRQTQHNSRNGHNDSAANAVAASRSITPTELPHEHHPPPPRSPPLLNPTPRRKPSSATELIDKMKETPFPQIRGGRLERLFFSLPEHDAKMCTICRCRYRSRTVCTRQHWSACFPRLDVREAGKPHDGDSEDEGEDEGFVEGPEDAPGRDHDAADPPGRRHALDAVTAPPQDTQRREEPPPQTLLVSVLTELEDDFIHYKSIYVELADEYKLLDPFSDVQKRKLLAHHLQEVIDILERKSDQITSLYDLSVVGPKPRRFPPKHSAPPTQ